MTVEEYVRAHVSTVDDKRSLCLLCGKEMSSHNIRRHFKEVHDKGTAQYRCHLCKNKSMVFTVPRRLQSHISRCHPQPKPSSV